MGSIIGNTNTQGQESPILASYGVYKKYTGSTTYANININLSIARGQVCGLLGPNGAGKTTFVRQACGLLRPTSGRIEVGGLDIATQRNYVPQIISYLGQIAYTHRALKVIEFIQFTGVYRGLTPKQAITQAREYLEYFDMLSLENQLLEYLSGGETRIVAFIAAIIGFKPLVVLDEPTNDVDPEKRIKLWKLVKALKNDYNISFLLVTHNIHEAADVVDTVAIINNGEIIKEGVPNELADSMGMDIKIDLLIPYNLDISEKILCNHRVDRIDDEHIRIYVNKESIQRTLNDLYSDQIGEHIRSIKITPPSLEDIYLRNIQENNNEK